MRPVMVMLPVFNAEQYIRESVGSVLNQTFAEFDVYVIDDGSTDNTVAILQTVSDPRLHMLQNDGNKGLIFTLNKGLELAIEKGYQYIARMDADDICLPDRLQKQVTLMQSRPEIGVCGSWVEQFSGTRTIEISQRSSTHEQIASELFFQNTIWHPSVIIRTSVIQQYNIRYETAFLHAEDYALWCRLAGVTQLANIGEVLLKYRVHGSNVSKIYGEQQRKTAVQINGLNLSHFLLSHPLCKLPDAEKQHLSSRYVSLLDKIAADAVQLTTADIHLFQQIIDLNRQTDAFNQALF